jgi:hypothetical protein
MRVDFVHLHSSGRFDRSAAAVRDDLVAWLRDDAISLMTLTEFSRNRRRAVIEQLDGWSLFNGNEHSGADDCIIAWRTSTWELVKTESAVVSTKRSYRANGKLIPPQRVTSVLLLHKPTALTLLVSVSHLPSHVELDGRLRANLRAAVWRDATHRWQRHLVALRNQWQPTARLVVADWNVSIRGAWFRRYLRELFPVMSPVWRTPYPRRGTLGKRIIDVALISRRLVVAVRPRLLKQHRSSDHSALKTGLSWRQ